MKNLVTFSLGLIKTATLKDTAILFAGNFAGAFLGFLLLLVLARELTVEQMGTFSAITNLVILLSALVDPGVTSGLVNFIAGRDIREQNKYLSATFRVSLILFVLISIFVMLGKEFVANELLATEDTNLVIYVVTILFANVIWIFASQALKARKRFLPASIIDVVTSLLRLIGVLIIGNYVLISTASAVSIYSLATLIGALFGIYILGTKFIFVEPKKDTYYSLLKFSSWLGVNKISSTISSKVDVQMLAALAGAASTGYYSIPARLVFFVSLLLSSFSSVISPRLAAFSSKDREKEYIKKTLFFSIFIVIGLISWLLISEPFILILFGDKYYESIHIFRLLLISIIPMALTAPSSNAIVYSIKQPKYIGYFSIFQLIATIVLNLYLIPIYKEVGPTISLFVINSLFAIYSWLIVLRHYSKTN